VQNVCGGSSVILLEGNRRTGKTSILKHLNKSPDLQGWVRVYCSFQSTEGQKGVAGVPTGEVFYSIARELILAVHEAGYACDIPGLGILNQNLSKASLRHSLLMKLHPLFEGAAPFEQFQIIVEAAISAVKPDRILLMHPLLVPHIFGIVGHSHRFSTNQTITRRILERIVWDWKRDLRNRIGRARGSFARDEAG
jgi:hypothetical protein